MTDYKLVPMEPTDEMVFIGVETLRDKTPGIEWDHDLRGTERLCDIVDSIFSAMLDAAPDVQGEPASRMVPSRDDLIQCLLATHGQSEGITADAILSMLTAHPQPAEQQPVEGEEIMVNTPYDVFTLPLQPSGLLSGPRFVVHVPGPEQPAAPDVEALVEALQGLLNIVSDSFGVAGYHLNGNIANWDEFEEVENAEIALSTYHKQGGGDK